MAMAVAVIELAPTHGYLDGRDTGVVSKRIAGLDPDWWALKGNGGMQASAKDMYRWYLALSGRAALGSGHIDAALTPRVHSGSGNNREAYGWNIGVDAEGAIERVNHAGSDGVFFSYFWWRHGDELFFYLVGNSGEAQVLDAVRGVRSRLLRQAASQ